MVAGAGAALLNEFALLILSFESNERIGRTKEQY